MLQVGAPTWESLHECCNFYMAFETLTPDLAVSPFIAITQDKAVKGCHQDFLGWGSLSRWGSMGSTHPTGALAALSG